MQYDITDRVKSLWEYYDAVLEERLAKIAEIAEVDRSHLIKINPAEFIEANKQQIIRGYKYQKIENWIKATKTADDIFLISPLDAINETAAQVSYKSNTSIEKTIRASKCEVLPLPIDAAQDFFLRNHRQKPPLVRKEAITFALVFKGEVVAVMLYDISNGAIRGNNEKFELVRLSIKKNYRVHGGASKLQKACEAALIMQGATEIYSYSNATINSGAVYRELGFEEKKINEGQPFVILENNKLERLINLFPDSTDKALAVRGRIKTHVSGNKTWIKKISGTDGTDGTP